MAAVQTYRNHARFDPPFHFFVVPILLINVFVAAGVTIHEWPFHSLLHVWLVVVSLALLVLARVARTSALRAQDRVIRLEEKLRYGRLLGQDELGMTERLSLRQVAALRFASDEELPGLVRRALMDGMEPKAIKQAIVEWRPDLYRV